MSGSRSGSESRLGRVASHLSAFAHKAPTWYASRPGSMQDP
jgi:hypothetical protein